MNLTHSHRLTVLDRIEELKNKLLVEITAIVTEIDDHHPIYNQDLFKQAGQYRVFDSGMAFLAIELVSGYKLVLIDKPSCCANHFFEFPAEDIKHVVDSRLMAVTVDSSTYHECDDTQDHTVLETMTMVLLTDKLMVRFPIYNGHNGFYSGIDPELIIIDEKGQYVAHGKVPTTTDQVPTELVSHP